MQKELKKYIGVVLLFLLYSIQSWAQNANLDYKSAIKIYNLSLYEQYNKTRHNSINSATHFEDSTTLFQILHSTIAFQWKGPKNNFNEIELSSLKFGKLGTKTEYIIDSTGVKYRVSGMDNWETNISFRYEYILNLNKSDDHKFVPTLGLGISVYFRQNLNHPTVSSSFPDVESYAGIRSYLTPGFTYYSSKKLFFDIDIPFCLFDTYYHGYRTDNPQLPVKERATKNYNFEVLAKRYSFRFGFGYKL